MLFGYCSIMLKFFYILNVIIIAFRTTF